MIKRQGRYWMLKSGSSGWAPNAARAYSAEKLEGPWADHGNPCTGTNPHNGLGADFTFGGQAAFIVRVEGIEDAYIASFDINRPEHPYESGYIWLPISFEGGRMSIPWRGHWSPSGFRALSWS